MNCQSVLKAEKIPIITKKLKALDIDILALQETKKTMNISTEFDGYKIIYSSSVLDEVRDKEIKDEKQQRVNSDKKVKVEEKDRSKEKVHAIWYRIINQQEWDIL